MQHLDGQFDGSSPFFASVPGPVQTVQRAEHSVVIFALQAFSGTHVAIVNLNVLRGVSRLLDNCDKGVPLSLLTDGDLLATIHFDSVKIFTVKGRADRFMVADGTVRQDDSFGNDGADTASELGRLRQCDGVISWRRALLRAGRHSFPVVVIFTNSWSQSLGLGSIVVWWWYRS